MTVLTQRQLSRLMYSLIFRILFVSLCCIIHPSKAESLCLLFSIKFLFFRNCSPLKTVKNVFFISSKKPFSFSRYIFKFLYIRLPLFFFPASHCFRGWFKKNLKVCDVITCLNKDLITHFVWYLEKEIRCDIETLSIDRVLNTEHFYGKIMQKMCTKS